MDLILASMNYPPAIGGVELLCERLAHHLHLLGVSVHVVAPRVAHAASFDATAPYPITRFAAGALRQPRLALALEPLTRGGTPVLFGQWTAASLTLGARSVLERPARVAALGHGKEFLLGGSSMRNSGLFARYMRQVLERIELLAAVSHYTAELARSRGAPRVEVIHPGVELERFQPNGPASGAFDGVDGPRVLTVTRLVPRKGVDTAIEAVATIVERYPGLCYCVAGDGPDRQRLERLAVERGVADHVRFLGRVADEDLPALYRSADVMVLASRLEPDRRDVEGFGIVLLEAQACGTAVVAARSGGMPDAVLEGETGVLVPESDAPALSTVLGDLLADRDALEAMGHRARAHAETRSWQRAARELVTALRL